MSVVDETGDVESKDMWRRQYPDMAVQSGILLFVREAWQVAVSRMAHGILIDSAWRAQEQKVSVFSWYKTNLSVNTFH